MMTGLATTIATATIDGRWLRAARQGELEDDTP